MEEIARQHRRCLGPTELAPRRTGAPRSGIKPCLSQDVPDCRRGDSIAKPDEFAVDAAVAPARVLPANRIARSPMTAAVRGRPPAGYVPGE